jgi:carbon storage regulator CsrA
MLVLTRKLQERICIGENITVTVLRVKGQQVRIGIEAPRDVRVIRGELPPNAMPGDTKATKESEPLVVDLQFHDDECSTGECNPMLTSDEGETTTVLAGRGRPVAMQQFVRSILDTALAK